MSRRFLFSLFRLNIEDIEDLFNPSNVQRLRGDGEITQLLQLAVDSNHDQTQRTRSAIYKWSVREFRDYSNELTSRPFLELVLARSVLERDGDIVTDDGISRGTSAIYPPLAGTAVCLFDLRRHLIIVENNGELAPTSWKDFLEKILASASRDMNRASVIQLEPIPERNGIVGLFLSFERVTRMRVTLRLPNPELTRYTQNLFDDLVHSGIREITQDMKNPNGVSKAEDARPMASAILAEQGYKKGEVQIEGFRNDQFEQVISGDVAARGSIRGLREYIRGMHHNARAKETKQALAAIAAEIDRIHPIPE